MDAITIEELYELAKAYGVENMPLVLNYFCRDDYYGFEGYNVQISDITVNNNGMQISV